MTPIIRKPLFLTLCVLGCLVTTPSVRAGTGLGLVTITSPANGQVTKLPGATTVSVHLEVVFGHDLLGNPADPLTFSASMTGMGSSVLTPQFTDVKDANGKVTGKKADVTVPLKSKYSFHAKVASVLVNGKRTKDSVKVAFLPLPGGPVIQNFQVSNPAGFAADGNPVVNVGQGVTFQADLSDTDGDSITSYVLDLGDGIKANKTASSLTLVDESTTYSAPGDYTVTLTASDPLPLSVSKTLAIHVHAPPVAKMKINPTQGTFRYPVTFDAFDSSDPQGGAVTYTWDFGDGSAHGTGVQTSHTYPTPTTTKATYAVTLTMSDVYGSSATAKSSVLVTSTLTGDTMLTVTSPMNGEVATVGTTLPVNIVLGKASSGADPDLTTFKVLLNGVNVTGTFTPVKDPARGNIIVGEQASFPASQIKLGGLTNNLTATVKSKAFTTASGSTRTILTKKVVYFTATTAQPPTASFTTTPTEVQVGDVVTYDGSASNDPQGKALTYAWDFGDGNSAPASSSAVVTHAYAAEGTYTTKLTVSNGSFTASTDNSADPVLVRAVVSGGGTPQLAVDINAVNFGDLNGQLNIAVGDGTTAYHYPAWVEQCVEVTNTGTGLLSVGSVTIDNPAFQVRNASRVTSVKLAAGESYFVGLSFDPRSYTGTAADPIPGPPAATGPYAGTLTIHTNGGDQAVSLAGNVVTTVPGNSIRLMRGDTGFFDGIHAPENPDDQGQFLDFIHSEKRSAAVVDVGVAATNKQYEFRGVINQGPSMGTITGVEVTDDNGNPSPVFGAQMVTGYYGDAHSPESSASVYPDSSMMSNNFRGDTGIMVTFTPNNTGGPQRFSGRLRIHVDYDNVPPLVVGVTGLGVFDAIFKVSPPFDGFEFKRVTLGGSANQVGSSSDGLQPAAIGVTNSGRKVGTVAASISGLTGGSAPAFTLNKASTTLNPGQQDTFTVTFTPSALGHSSAILKVTPEDDSGAPLSFEPPTFYLLHGFCKGSGGPGIFGTPGNLYTFDDSDFNQTEMLAFTGSAGSLSAFSQLDGIQDPFEIAGNTVDMSDYNGDWSNLVMLAGKEYTIDSGVLGPYSLTNADGSPNTQLNGKAQTRLQGGGKIYGGCIESSNAFVPGINGNVDIQDEGIDVNRLDATPDGIVFYTEVAAPNGSTTTTALRWMHASNSTGGTISASLDTLLGQPNVEVLDLRAVKTATGYRVFVVFDAQDASNNQIMGDLDLSLSFAVTAHKSLTGTASSTPESDTGSPMILDKNGVWFSAVSTQNPNGSTLIQVYKEDLHAGASSKALFAQTTVNLSDNVNNILVDNAGNVIVTTDHGLCAFSSSGAFGGYTLSGTTFFADSFAGGSSGSDTFDLSDLTVWWMDK